MSPNVPLPRSPYDDETYDERLDAEIDFSMEDDFLIDDRLTDAADRGAIWHFIDEEAAESSGPDEEPDGDVLQIETEQDLREMEAEGNGSDATAERNEAPKSEPSEPDDQSSKPEAQSSEPDGQPSEPTP